MMAMTTRSSINVKARSQAVSRGDQESVRVLTVPLLGTVKSGFMVSMHAKKREGVSMNLHRPSNRSLPWKSGAEDARTPNASRLPTVCGPREAFVVRASLAPLSLSYSVHRIKPRVAFQFEPLSSGC